MSKRRARQRRELDTTSSASAFDLSASRKQRDTLRGAWSREGGRFTVRVCDMWRPGERRDETP